MNLQPILQDSDSAAVRETCEKSSAAAADLEQAGRTGRAAALRGVADALERYRSDIINSAEAETGLDEGRLNSELTRTCYQFNHFAEVLEEGSYLEVVIDHSGETKMGARPDLRRMLVPLGPVAVFGASNFPLAFSVPGGDTVAALAAGCPVVVKGHPSHPVTSAICAEIMIETLVESGLPENALQLILGLEAGRILVQDSAMKAVAFTGSLGGGKALLDSISKRSDPIPFYGELSSINPVVVMPGAAQANARSIGLGLAQSGTVGNGQFCTKPQLLFLPSDTGGDLIVETIREEFNASGPQKFLNESIAASFAAGIKQIQSQEKVSAITPYPTREQDWYRPSLVTLPCTELSKTLMEEVFGPVQVVARYSCTAELLAALNSLPASLTATVHVEQDDQELAVDVMNALREKAGRFIFNGYPTGVSVAWAQHHGGPWPATSSLHTSVGASSIRRFLRPIAFQSAPEWILPPELRDDMVKLPKRVDGLLR